MKVTGQTPSSLLDIKGGQSKDGADAAQLSKGGTLQNDVVKNGSFAVDKMKLRIEAEPEVRADKVAEIKARIKSGEYQVDTQALARNLLKEGLQESTS